MRETMWAAVYHGLHDLRLERRPVPELQDPRDAIVRVTRSAICTSDLHILAGAVPRAVPGTILGHEFVGQVVKVGAAIHTLKPGDRVAANCETFCGDCFFCRRGYVNNCVHGGWELGCRIDGGQAEYVRVPFADTGLTLIPSGVSYEQALFVGDILSSGWFGAELLELRPGDTVAVIGAGPVGLCAMACARLLGAGTIIAADIDPHRLQVARDNGLADVFCNPQREDLESVVLRHTGGRGADGVIEAAGGPQTFETAWRIARPNAVVALVAMYEEDQNLPLPRMYGKNLIFKTGGVDACHCKELLDRIANRQLNTDFLITHSGSLQQIEEGYALFASRRDHCLKWMLNLDI